MTVPTRGEVYAQLIEHLRLAQEAAAMLAHLHNTETKDKHLALGWLQISEMFKQTQYRIIQFATRARQ